MRLEVRRRSITVALFFVISPPSTCSHSGNVCKRVGGVERERAPITCFSQDDSSVCGKALHPFAFTFPHLSPFPNPSEGKNGTAGGGNYRTAGHLFSFSSTPRSTFLGRRSSFRISPTGPPPRRRRWMGRCEGCFVGVRAPLWYRFDDSSPQSPPYPYSHPLPFIQ